MDFLYVIVFIIGILGIKWEYPRLNAYMNKEQTEAINGFFVLLVFFRHFAQYIAYGKYDLAFQRIDSILGQLIVTTFLFYSGYGIAYSLKNKQSYLKSLPKRFIKVLLHFDMAIFLYLILNICLNNHYSIKTVLLSLIGWESLGNSNWYIFAILCMYIITYICGLFCKSENKNYLILFITLGGVLYASVLKCVGKSGIWYCNILCFPAGMLYGYTMDRINDVIRKRKRFSFFYPICTFIAFGLLYVSSSKFIEIINISLYELASVMFCLFIVAVTLFFKIGNPILSWLGKHVFEIYILQRLPMILFQNKVTNKYLYFMICLIFTILISILFSKIEKITDGLLFDKRVK